MGLDEVVATLELLRYIDWTLVDSDDCLLFTQSMKHFAEEAQPVIHNAYRTCARRWKEKEAKT